MKKSFRVSAFVLLCAAGFLFFTGCSKNQQSQTSSSKKSKKSEQTEAVPHGVVFGGGYWRLSGEDDFSYFTDAIPGTSVELLISGGKAERKNLGEDGAAYVHIRLDDEDFWIAEKYLVQDAFSQYILETGTEIFLYREPDADSERIEKLTADTIVAFLGPCPESTKYVEASKFGKIKIPAETDGEYVEGYVRLTNLNDDPAHLAMIQVSRKYVQLVNSGTASTDVLNELEDIIDELNSWSGR